MENKKLKQTNTALSKVLQSEFLQTVKTGDFKKASDLLPSRIEMVFDQPKINEMILAIGARSVSRQVEFELVKFSTLLNVSGNLTDSQVTFIADQLIQKYPNESIADFKLCLTRGLTGNYGDIYRMDSIILFGWMEKYLEEKYQVLENQLMKERDTPYNPQPPSKSIIDWTAKWLESIQDKKKGPSTVQSIPKNKVLLEGKEIPLKRKHEQSPKYAIQLKISLAAAEYYKTRPYDYTSMRHFSVDGFEIFAQNLEEAREIYFNIK